MICDHCNEEIPAATPHRRLLSDRSPAGAFRYHGTERPACGNAALEEYRKHGGSLQYLYDPRAPMPNSTHTQRRNARKEEHAPTERSGQAAETIQA